VVNLSLQQALKNNDEQLKIKVLKALNSGHDKILEQPFWHASHIQSLFSYQKNF